MFGHSEGVPSLEVLVNGVDIREVHPSLSSFPVQLVRDRHPVHTG